jgi:ABC-type uncharacterized transport system involved in gliding motility auxiliary subunit
MKKLRYMAAAGPFLMMAGLLYYSVVNLWDLTAKIIFFAGLALTLLLCWINVKNIKAGFRRRSAQYGANTLLMVVAVVGILGLLNYMGKKHHYRTDFSSGQLYSLSDQTVKIVKGLKNEVDIYLFAKEPQQRMNDLLNEYKDLNTSKIVFRVVDPQKNPSQTKKYGVRSFDETVVVSGEKSEKVESAQEESITNAIVKVTREKNKTIYFTTGHNEGDTNGEDGRGYSFARKSIEGQNYTVKSINLATTSSFPEDCSEIVIAGPKTTLLPTEVAQLEKYVDAGGKVLLLQDPEADSGLADLLKKWNVGLDDDVVVDSSGLGQLFGMGPAVPLVSSYETHPITKDMTRVMTFFPMARSVQVLKEAGSSFTAAPLFKSSESSWGEKNLKNNEAQYNEGVDIKGPVNLAVVSTKAVTGDGKSKSYGKEARVVVVGDSDFAMNNYFRKGANGDLFLNTISWLAEDEDLISIRPKNQENRSVQLTQARSKSLFWLAMIFMPAAILIAGVAVWLRRR